MVARCCWSLQVYWNFGGSTVLTKSAIRLTPSTQDRRGWLWNEYPLESPHWEMEYKLEVFSKTLVAEKVSA